MDKSPRQPLSPSLSPTHRKKEKKLMRNSLSQTHTHTHTPEHRHRTKIRHGKLLARIASESGQSQEKFREVMGVLVERIQGAWKKPKQWRWAYKSLLVIDFMVKNGPEQIVGELTDDESMDIFSDLQRFEFVEEDTMRDHGVNVRKRATDIAALLRDPERLEEERETARKSKAKLGGHGRNSSWQSGGGGGWSPGPLTETENAAGWGKQRKLVSGPTLVRTKPSFTVPAPVKLEERPNAGEGLGEAPVGAAAAAAEDPFGLAEAEQTDGRKGTQVKGKGKAKLLSETKVNPKMRLSLKGFKGLSKPPGNPSGGGGSASTLEADLMGLSVSDQPQPPPHWDDFASTQTAPAAGNGEWSQFESPAKPAAAAAKPVDPFDLVASLPTPPPPAANPWAAGPAAAAVPLTAPTGGSGGPSFGTVGSVGALDPSLFSAPAPTLLGSQPAAGKAAPTAQSKEGPDPFSDLGMLLK